MLVNSYQLGTRVTLGKGYSRQIPTLCGVQEPGQAGVMLVHVKTGYDERGQQREFCRCASVVPTRCVPVRRHNRCSYNPISKKMMERRSRRTVKHQAMPSRAKIPAIPCCSRHPV